MLRIVCDVGNTRVKWGRVDDDGELLDVASTPNDDPDAWATAWERFGAADRPGSSWAVSTVNPNAAGRLAGFLDLVRPANVRWFRSAADVPLRHTLAAPEQTGADRALAVLGARTLRKPGCALRVVLCGTAITVERVTADGAWQGGAIAAGLGLAAWALHARSGRLPAVSPAGTPPPPAWGNATRPAMEAGLYWGAVGAVRELLTRQADGPEPPPVVVWSGGDAEAIARGVEGDRAVVLPNLVLRGLAEVCSPRGV